MTRAPDALSGATVWLVQARNSTSLPVLFSSEELAREYIAARFESSFWLNAHVVDEYAPLRVGEGEPR